MRSRHRRWRLRSARGADAADARWVLDAVERGTWPPGTAVVKRSRVREVARVALPSGDVAFVKHVHGEGGPAAWVRRSQAMRELHALEALHERDLPAVEPLFAAVARGRSVLATREVPGAERLRDRLLRAAPAERDALLHELGALARRLHERGLWHRDLHTGNVLVRPGGSAGPRLVLVDVQKLRRLPLGVPARLRHADLGLLADDLSSLVPEDARQRMLAAYAAAGPAQPDVRRLSRAVARAAARRRVRRLRSRGRRCVVPSRGFRIEREAGRRIFRRADVPRESVDAALARHAALGEAEGDPTLAGGIPRRVSHVGALPGGPLPGTPPRRFARGYGAPEPGAPAHARVRVVEWPERGVSAWVGRLRGGRGRRAWRNAHALLLRELDTPAPLALVEEIRGPRLVRSFLLVRDEPMTVLAGGKARPALERAVREIHAAGVLATARGPQRVARRDDAAPEEPPLLLEPGSVAVRRRLSSRAARRDRERLLAAHDAAPALGQRRPQAGASSSR